MGLLGGLRRTRRLRRALPVARERGLPRAHHDRHARRADLPVPAVRDARDPRSAAASVAERQAASGARRRHRPRAREVRSARGAVPRTPGSRRVAAQARDRHPQRALQHDDRGARAGRDVLEGCVAAHRGDRHRQDPAVPAVVRAQACAPVHACEARAARRGQLRDACAATSRCRCCSATPRARSPARRSCARACCARATRGWCSSTRSASSAATSRRCCSPRSRTAGSTRSAPTSR